MSDVIIHQERFKNTSNSCIGKFVFDGETYYTLEDPVREKKIKHVTAIDCGVYELRIKRVVTPLTQVYRNRYKWFDYHIEILNVPNYSSVYQHIGNYPKDTDGCQLIGSHYQEDMVTNSTKTFKKYYEKVTALLKNGDRVFINIEECING